jgi:aspartate aminotransferase
MSSEQNSLSAVSRRLTGQPMFKLLHKAQAMEREGRRILHFEIGDCNFPSPQCAVDAAKYALDSGSTHYVNSKGILEFREAIADYTEREWQFRPDPEQVLVCPANAVIDFIVRCVADPGDEIIFPDPGFPTYISVANYNGIKGIPVKLSKDSGYRLKAEDVARQVTPKTKLIIINSPSNPTGTMMDPEDITAIAELALKRGIYLLSDEIYSKILYDCDHFSPALTDRCKEKIILLNSFSKVHSMSGWRLGYAVGPVEVINKMGLLLETIFSCIPPFIQLAGTAVLRDNARHLPHRVSLLKERRDILFNSLNQLPNISCAKPDGAFYMFPDVSGTGLDASEYCHRLLHEQGVCFLPGECFGESGRGHVRISFGTTSLEVILEALEKLKTFHKSLAKASR